MPTPTQVEVGGSTLTWHEQIDSGAGEVVFNAASSERRWLVTKCYDPDDLIASAPAVMPLSYFRGLVRHILRSYKYDPAQPTDGSLWQVVAAYAFMPEHYELSFDTSGATTKLMTALDEGTYYNCVTPGVTVPSFNRLVGVTESGVEGVEVPIPKFDFTVLIRNRFLTLPASYIETIGDLSGKTNDRPLTIVWKGQRFNFGTEELLFQGMPGKMTSDEGFELTLKFSKSKSRAGGTLVTAPYLQPEVGGEATVTVQSVSLFANGQRVFIVGGGMYDVTGISGLQLTLILLDRPGITAATGTTILRLAGVSTDPYDYEPLVIGASGAITKPGWRYLWTQAARQNADGRINLRPSVAVVNKVIRTADLSPIGIFS